MGKSIEDCLEAKEWVDLFDAIDVNKKGSLNMKGTVTEQNVRLKMKKKMFALMLTFEQ